jgi:uncharacterized protein
MHKLEHSPRSDIQPTVAASGEERPAAECRFQAKAPFPPGKYVDLHVHMERAPNEERKRFTFEALLSWMDQHDVSQAVVQTIIRLPESTGAGEYSSDTLLKQFKKCRPRLFPFVVIFPDTRLSDPELSVALRRFKEAGVIGFGELIESEGADARYIDDPKCMRLYEACIDAGFPVLFHMDNKSCTDEPGLPHLTNVLQSFPECTFIAHGPGWWASISGDVKTREQFHAQSFNHGPYPTGKVVPGGAVEEFLTKYPNLYADLCGSEGRNALERDPEFGRGFVVRNADRLLFGTDTIRGDMKRGPCDILHRFQLPGDVEGKILRDNARSLLPLSG